MTKSGALKVWKEEEKFVMDFPTQDLEVCDISVQIEKAFGVKPLYTYASMDYIVVFDNEDDVYDAKPDLAVLETLDLRGVCITAKSLEYDFVTRFFAPKYGIDEDSVTGSAFTQVVNYWKEELSKDVLYAKQVSARSGEVKCHVKDDRVEISGEAVKYFEGEINII